MGNSRVLIQDCPFVPEIEVNNAFRTFFLMLLLTLLFVWIGGEIGGARGAFVAFLAAVLIRMMISRVREYSADEDGACLSAKPLALAGALGKLQQAAQQIPLQRGNPAHAHMFTVNPFLGGLQRLFSTHPPVEDRIKRLRSMAAQPGTAAAIL
ncbi:M48 family metalloprotease [candidate division KSB1 bacterium]|nr:M48 family metalloprotease [candidate division KSB1 bacterium]